MVAKPFSDYFLKSIKPPKRGRIELWDKKEGGFGLRITDKGTRTFVLMYRVRGEGLKKRLTIGEYPAYKLEEARDIAREAKKQAKRGVDPKEEKKRKEELIKNAKANRLSLAVDEYFEKYAKVNTRSWKKTLNIFNLHIKPALGNHPLDSIRPKDIKVILEKLMSESKGYMANRILSHLSHFFKWCVENEKIEMSPVTNISRVFKEKTRDRVLDEEEIKLFWQAADDIKYPFGDIYKLCLLTGQRLNEVAKMKWSHLKFKEKIWEQPKEAVKTGKAHQVPLCGLAFEIISNIRKQRSDYIFTTTGKTPVSGFSRAKIKCDELSGIAKDYRIHDLRRTVSTYLSKLGTSQHITEKILNHQDGVISGVAAVYNRYSYNKEKRIALTQWEKFLKKILKR